MKIICSERSGLGGILYLWSDGLGRQGIEGWAMFAEEIAENILEYNNIKMADNKSSTSNSMNFRKTKNDSLGIILPYVIQRMSSNFKRKTLKSNGAAQAFLQWFKSSVTAALSLWYSPTRPFPTQALSKQVQVTPLTGPLVRKLHNFDTIWVGCVRCLSVRIIINLWRQRSPHWEAVPLTLWAPGNLINYCP